MVLVFYTVNEQPTTYSIQVIVHGFCATVVDQFQICLVIAQFNTAERHFIFSLMAKMNWSGTFTSVSHRDIRHSWWYTFPHLNNATKSLNIAQECADKMYLAVCLYLYISEKKRMALFTVAHSVLSNELFQRFFKK